MPAQPPCFHRLDEILALLWGLDTGYLDRQAPSDGGGGENSYEIQRPSRDQDGRASYAPVVSCLGAPPAALAAGADRRWPQVPVPQPPAQPRRQQPQGNRRSIL